MSAGSHAGARRARRRPVDWISGLALGTVGESPGERPRGHRGGDGRTGQDGHRAHARSRPEEARAADGRDPPVEDLIVTTRTSYHVLRFVETGFDSSVFLHLWLDRDGQSRAGPAAPAQNLAEGLVLG